MLKKRAEWRELERQKAQECSGHEAAVERRQERMRARRVAAPMQGAYTRQRTWISERVSCEHFVPLRQCFGSRE
jgi:hypothetical protein